MDLRLQIIIDQDTARTVRLWGIEEHRDLREQLSWIVTRAATEWLAGRDPIIAIKQLASLMENTQRLQEVSNGPEN